MLSASCFMIPSLAGLLVGIETVAADSSGRFPAAREHMRFEEGKAWRYKSRLTSVMELDFTYGYTHEDGKAIISRALARIADGYGAEGKPAFRILRIAGGARGDRPAPPFTLEDLLRGEVIVANNVGQLGAGALGEVGQASLKSAIDSAGRGYLAFHGTAQSNLVDERGWSWFQDALMPRDYQGHNIRTQVPVYVHRAEARHVVLEDVLTRNTTEATVPDETDADGVEVLARNVPVRSVYSENFWFGRDITRDPAYRDRVTLLLKHDERSLGTSTLPGAFRRPGGGVHSYLYRVGRGMTAYIPEGHDDQDTMRPATGFDGGVGDFDRYVAQLLFFLAGYEREPCDSSCGSLPIVDARDHIVPVALGMGPLSPVEKAGKGRWIPGADVLGRIKETKATGRPPQVYSTEKNR